MSSSYRRGRNGLHGQAGGQVAAGQEVHHRRVRVRHLQRARQRETAARHRRGNRMSAGPVPSSRCRGCGKHCACFPVALFTLLLLRCQ